MKGFIEACSFFDLGPCVAGCITVGLTRWEYMYGGAKPLTPGQGAGTVLTHADWGQTQGLTLAMELYSSTLFIMTLSDIVKFLLLYILDYISKCANLLLYDHSAVISW